MATLDRLYELYNIISASGEQASKSTIEYEEILLAAKGGSAEKRLASQFIAKFFHLFPTLQKQALDSMFDLCEDEDLIRAQAVKELPTMCRHEPKIIPKVADIFAQLLLMDDALQTNVIYSSLVSLFKLDAKGTLTGLLFQVENSLEDKVRERCLQFISAKLPILGPDVITPQVEELIMKEAKCVISGATEVEFILMIEILQKLKISKTVKGHQQLVDLVCEKLDLTQSVIPGDQEAMSRLATCLKQAMPFFSSQVRSTKVVEYLCREVLPFMDIGGPSEDHRTEISLQLDVLRILCEIMPHSGLLESIPQKVSAIYNMLLPVMPLPPTLEDGAEALDFNISLEFSKVECLLFLFHKFAADYQEFLTEDAERLKDFRLRLQYFSRGSQAYHKKLRESLQNIKGNDLKSDENKLRLIGIKTTANINSLIKDLFHQPPSYKAKIVLSWIDNESKSLKRHAPITFDENKSPRTDRKIYAPPRDKFSRGAGRFNYRGGRGRGMRRGNRPYMRN